MTNEEETKEVESTPDNTSKGIQPKTDSPIEQANKAVEKLKAENDRTEELLTKKEEQIAADIVGGKSEAGNPKVEEPEETPKEYKDRVMAGGLNKE